MPTIRPLGPADPARIASFKVTGRIGEGGHGVVYAAETGSGERVAVKVLQRRFWEDDEVRRAFGADLRQAQRVTGEHIARVLAYGIHQQRLYYACEYVDGPSLWEIVERRGPRQADEIEALAVATLSALASVHAAGTAHGGFKPGSVLLGPDGPRVIDFGVGRALDGPPTPGRLIGTSPFTAPEHLVGAGPGPDGDMFAWAGTMVYAATGHPPFGQDSVPAVISRILSETPDLSALPGTLLDAVTACLDKVPARRPTARELLARLTGAGLTAAPAAGWSAPAAPPLPPDILEPGLSGRAVSSPAAPDRAAQAAPASAAAAPSARTAGAAAAVPVALAAVPLAPGPQEEPMEVPAAGRHGRGHRDRTYVLAGAALALIVAVMVALVVSPGDPPRARIPGAVGSPLPPGAVPSAAVPSLPETPAPPPGATVEPTPVPSPSPEKPEKSERPLPVAPPTTTHPPAPVLHVSPGRVRVKSDYDFAVNIRLRAPGGAVTWRATITEGAVLSSTRGRIRAGSSATITVYGTPYCSTSKVRFTSNGGTRTVTIVWGGVRC